MKRGVSILAAVAALWALPVFADPADDSASVFVPTQGEQQYLARDLMLFAKVQNADGEIVGDIEDLILNTDNQIEGVVMGTGGFAGFGEKRVGVRLDALQIKNDDGKITVVLPQATKETIDGLEPFKRTKPPKSLLDRAIERARELSAKSSVTARDAYERAKEESAPALEKAREAAKEAYEDVKEATKPALEKASKAAKGAYEGAREALETEPETAPETPSAPATDTPSQ